jgi:hypothetical protein
MRRPLELALHFNLRGGDMNAMKKFIYLGLLAGWCAVPGVSFADKCAGTNIKT